MPEPIRLPDDPAPFRQWLSSLPAEQVVGRCNSPYGCPLAEFLKSQGGELPDVGADVYNLRDEDYEETPQWAALFICAVDVDEDLPTHQVTAGECLQVLARVAP